MAKACSKVKCGTAYIAVSHLNFTCRYCSFAVFLFLIRVLCRTLLCFPPTTLRPLKLAGGQLGLGLAWSWPAGPLPSSFGGDTFRSWKARDWLWTADRARAPIPLPAGPLSSLVAGHFPGEPLDFAVCLRPFRFSLCHRSDLAGSLPSR